MTPLTACSHSRTVKFKEFKTDAFCLQEIQDSREVKYYQAFVCFTTNRMKIFMFSTQVDPKRTAILFVTFVLFSGKAMQTEFYYFSKTALYLNSAEHKKWRINSNNTLTVIPSKIIDF